jgi:hypothetical protein
LGGSVPYLKHGGTTTTTFHPFLISIMSFFNQKIDHSDDFIGQIYLDKRFNGYDIYTFCEEDVRIYHYPGDKYVVQEMVYDNSTGCLMGTQVTYGTFDNIDDAVECGRDVLADVALSDVA